MKKKVIKKIKQQKIGPLAKSFLDRLNRNHDKFLFLFTLVVIANVGFAVFVKGSNTICGLIYASKGYVESKVRNESVDHFVKTRKIVKGLESRISVVEDELGWPNDDVWLTGQERLDLIDQLQRLDEIAYELQWVSTDYFSDYSIQYYPHSTGNLAGYMYEVRHLQKAVERFVRIAETSILLDSFNDRQIQVIDSELVEVKAYLDNLTEFEQNLILLNGSCDEGDCLDAHREKTKL